MKMKCHFICLEKLMQHVNLFVYRKHRYTAYRQYVRWVYGYLGEEVRIPLPSCVYEAIQSTFVKGKDEKYVPFQPAHKK